MLTTHERNGLTETINAANAQISIIRSVLSNVHPQRPGTRNYLTAEETAAIAAQHAIIEAANQTLAEDNKAIDANNRMHLNGQWKP